LFSKSSLNLLAPVLASSVKKANQMDATPDAEIETQFRGLTRLLAEIAYCITQACSVPDTGENVYSELREVEGNITVLED
jgi:hypothetical protein